VNRERDAFLDFLNVGPIVSSRASFFNRVQGFYVTFREQLSKVQADAPLAQAVTDRNWRSASRKSVAETALFYGMFGCVMILSVVYLLIRRAGPPLVHFDSRLS
ncbi:MAG: hypothetical protein JO102_01410, partial [Elusimicrobia bacterium]|nr:hypothetical protein [Elusimicrobiota bacterium]